MAPKRLWINQDLVVAVDRLRRMTNGVWVQSADVTVDLQTIAGVSISGEIDLGRDMDYPARYTGQIDQQHTNSLVAGNQYDLWYTIAYGQAISVTRRRIYAAYRGDD